MAIGRGKKIIFKTSIHSTGRYDVYECEYAEQQYPAWLGSFEKKASAIAFAEAKARKAYGPGSGRRTSNSFIVVDNQGDES